MGRRFEEQKDDYNGYIGCLILFVIASLFVIAAIQPYFESQRYNKLTGAKTTYWDAVWLELRVQDNLLNSNSKNVEESQLKE